MSSIKPASYFRLFGPDHIRHELLLVRSSWSIRNTRQLNLACSAKTCPPWPKGIRKKFTLFRSSHWRTASAVAELSIGAHRTCPPRHTSSRPFVAASNHFAAIESVRLAGQSKLAQKASRVCLARERYSKFIDRFPDATRGYSSYTHTSQPSPNTDANRHPAKRTSQSKLE